MDLHFIQLKMESLLVMVNKQVVKGKQHKTFKFSLKCTKFLFHEKLFFFSLSLLLSLSLSLSVSQ